MRGGAKFIAAEPVMPPEKARMRNTEKSNIGRRLIRSAIRKARGLAAGAPRIARGQCGDTHQPAPPQEGKLLFLAASASKNLHALLPATRIIVSGFPLPSIRFSFVSRQSRNGS
jgi:hypothetical protein